MTAPSATERTQYVLAEPLNQTEAERLDTQHQAWLLQHNGLHSAPLTYTPGMRVLDVGCGTGVWSVAFATQHPDAHVHGIDISMPQPRAPPPNVSFEAADAEGDWAFAREPLDLIYGRMLVNSIRDWPRYMGLCWAHLKPGGWFELSDVAHRFFAEDGCGEGTSAMMRWWRVVFQGSSKHNGIDIDDSYRHAERLRRAGFTDVREQVFKWNVGGARGATDRERAIGELLKVNLGVLIEGVTATAIKHGSIGDMTVQEAKGLAEEAKRDVAENGERRGYYMNFVTFVGQKPCQ